MANTSVMNIPLINGSDYITPEAINNAFNTLDALGLDYITEMGTSGEWWYRKWKSGRAECGIDSRTFPDVTTSIWGSAFYMGGHWQFPAYPFSFSKPPFVTIMYRNDTNKYGGIIHIHPTTDENTLLTQPPQFSVADANGPHTYKSSKFGIFVTGVYK